MGNSGWAIQDGKIRMGKSGRTLRGAEVYPFDQIIIKNTIYINISI
jgi:hypothetical protein